MSETSSGENLIPEPGWQVEEFYFGLMEWATYRRSGERIQYQVEKGLPLVLRKGTSQYDASADEVAEFLAGHVDCTFTVADSYELNDGGREAPYLWVTGWVELSEEQRQDYYNAKANAWKKPEEQA